MEVVISVALAFSFKVFPFILALLAYPDFLTLHRATSKDDESPGPLFSFIGVSASELAAPSGHSRHSLHIMFA